MNSDANGQLILGVNLKGNKFRPSDWVDRIATTLASFQGQRLHYHPLLKPAYHEGMRCLFVDDALAAQEPEAYDFVMEFARNNGLQLQQVGGFDSYCTAA